MKNALEQISQFIDKDSDNLLADLKRLIAIPSVEGRPLDGKPFGEAVNQALDESLRAARTLGFEAQNSKGYVGIVDWGEGSETVGILVHVDIVPPGDITKWSSPPYELTEVGGYLCGRGVVDDKGPLLSVLYGMKALKSMGYTPKKKIRMIIGTNEETGWGGINYYKANFDEPDASFSPDGMFTVVNREKGIISAEYKKSVDWNGVSIHGGEAPNLVPANAQMEIDCKIGYLEDIVDMTELPVGVDIVLEQTHNGTKIVCKGKGAHAMTPEKGVNAISGLLSVLKQLKEPYGKIAEEAAAIYHLIGSDSAGTVLGIATRDDESGALTVNAGMMEIQDNVLSVKLDIRTPVTADIDQIADKVDTELEKIGFSKVKSKLKHPLYVPGDCELIRTLCKVYTRITGDEPTIFSIGGGTYARAFKNCVCFGSVYPDEKLTVHAPNEQTRKENVMKNAKMYALALYELTK